LKKKNYVFYYVIISIFAALLLLIFAFRSPLNINTVSFNEKMLLAIIIIIGCSYGVSLAFYPGWLKRKTKIKGNSDNEKKPTRRRCGHHPDCDKFEYHTIQIKNKTYCSGCLGLSLGSIIAIILIIIYLVFNIIWSSRILYSFMIIGLILIFLSYIETVFPRRNNIIHIISNIALVMGFFLATISIFEITGDIANGILGVLLCILWLDTRIQLSHWKHRKICSKCKENCKMY